MSEVVTRHDGATRGVAAQTLIRELMGQLVEAGRAAQEHRSRRELAIFETDFHRIALLVDALLDGNYQDTSARLANISASGVRTWLQHADNGDTRYQPVARLILAAEAVAEDDSLRDVRTAAKDPRFWAASMTFLERRHPDKWARRSEPGENSKVTINIGLATSQNALQVIEVQTPVPVTDCMNAIE